MELPYLAHFNLKEEPFSTVPSPRYLFLTPVHATALGKAEFVVETKKGLAVVFGDTGTGKSSLARLLHQKFLDRGLRSALVTNPSYPGPYSLLRTIAQEFGLPRLARSYKDLLDLFKEFLLDQTRVAGLGNIYVAEALWRAGISPRRRACNVGPVRAGRLHRAILDVLTEAIGRSGTSFGSTYLDFIDAEGEAGGFYDFLNVYDREDLPCPRCGAPIVRIVQGQRSTYFCPRCQR